MAVRHRQDAIDVYILYFIPYEMSNVGYVNIIKVALFKVTSDTFIKSIYLSGQRFESVCWQQPLC